MRGCSGGRRRGCGRRCRSRAGPGNSPCRPAPGIATEGRIAAADGSAVAEAGGGGAGPASAAWRLSEQVAFRRWRAERQGAQEPDKWAGRGGAGTVDPAAWPARIAVLDKGRGAGSGRDRWCGASLQVSDKSPGWDAAAAVCAATWPARIAFSDKGRGVGGRPDAGRHARRQVSDTSPMRGWTGVESVGIGPARVAVPDKGRGVDAVAAARAGTMRRTAAGSGRGVAPAGAGERARLPIRKPPDRRPV